MNFILWIIFGALAGWLASILLKTNESQGALMNIILGIIGAFIGGFLFNLFGAPGVTGFNIYSLLVAVLGSVVVVWVVSMLRRSA